MKKVSEAHFQKVLKRQKSANSTKKVLKRQIEKCSNDNFHKMLYINRKSLCNSFGNRMTFIIFGEDKDNKCKFI